METELKLKVAQPDLARLRQHPLLTDHATGVSVEHELHDIYYDTPNLSLWNSGLTLRVRADAGMWIQTVKTAAQSSAALHERGEWESRLDGPEPEPAQLARQIKSTRIADLLQAPGLARRLQPVFDNTTRRTTWPICLPDGQMVECTLDTGDLHAGGNNGAIGELEFELKHGNPAQLFELALALQEDIPLEIANDSKAARGYALLHSESVRPVKAARIHLKKKIRMEDALQFIGLNCLRQMEANVPGVLKQNVESLHQMRVGLRRLRALLDMFDDIAPLPAPIHDSLKWLTGELSATREWDVLAGSTIPEIQGEDLSELRRLAEKRAQALHLEMLQVLRQPRYTQLILQLNGWFYGRQWRSVAALPKSSPLASPARGAMVPLLRKTQRRLHRRIAGLDESDAPARHRVRIAAKKSRYAAEFFHDLLPAKQAKPYIRQLEVVQEILGHLNDLAVAQTLLRKFADSREAMYALGYVTAAAVKESQRLHGALAAIDRMKALG
ncbi:CHAD domain-containing protein [Oxalobacteraceae bacterium]|nr:CHAD domain-containing protein [Oxalobacteraceae bacterium]